MKRGSGFNHELRCYDDALAFVAEVQDAVYRRRRLKEKFSQGADSAVFDRLLKIPIYPYQRQAVLLAAEAGRMLLADEMGLGKTIQAIVACEIMAQEFGVQKVLVICPTSLKYQWKQEIENFLIAPFVLLKVHLIFAANYIPKMIFLRWLTMM